MKTEAPAKKRKSVILNKYANKLEKGKEKEINAFNRTLKTVCRHRLCHITKQFVYYFLQGRQG